VLATPLNMFSNILILKPRFIIVAHHSYWSTHTPQDQMYIFFKKIRYSWICFEQTFLGQGLGKLFPARESLVSDIPAGDRNMRNVFLQCSYWNMSKQKDHVL